MEVRKITSKQDEAKKRKRNQLVVGGILIAVMIFSTLGYSLQGDDSNDAEGNEFKINYNGHEFLYQNGLWIVNIGQTSFGFLHSPKEVEKITGEVKTLNNYVGKPLYISAISPTAEQEIYRNLDGIIQRRQYACLEGNDCYGDLPVKSCQDNFIIIKEDVVNNIIQEDNCVYIVGNYPDLPKLTDEFLFKTIGID